MPKIERRHTVVTLYQGGYEHQLQQLEAEAITAQTNDEMVKRQGSKSTAAKLAKKYDDLRREAEETAVTVTVWALSHREWSQLADQHPKRNEDSADQRLGFNTATLPDALIAPCLVEPEGASSLSDRVAKGQAVLDDLGDLSHVHHLKLQAAAWEVNTGDDDLPKYSLASLLQKRSRELGSEQQPDGE